MVFAFQNDGGEQQSVYNRNERVKRSLIAFMSYHSGYFEDLGFSAQNIDSRGHEAIPTYRTEGISERQAQACLSFNALFGATGVEAIRMDRHVLGRAIHMPPVNSQHVMNFPSPCTVHVLGQNTEGVPGTFNVTYDDYQQFLESYQDLAFCIEYYPEIVMDALKSRIIWQEFGRRINNDMMLRLEGEAFVPPEIRISGADDTLTINEVLTSQYHDGRLVTVVGQVLEMGDARKRAIRIAWKCMNPACGQHTFRIVDPFESLESKPTECDACGWGNRSITPPPPKAEFVQDGAPSTTFITFQRLMLRQTDTQMTTPPQILVEVRGSHVNAMNQGEDVAITGIFRTIEDRNGTKVERLPLLFGTDLTRTSLDSTVVVTEPERAMLESWKQEHGFTQVMDYLTAATASHVIGHKTEKTALLMQSVGSYRNLPDGKRPFIHVLFVGDPGTAKSELLKFATRMHPGSKRATGARSSVPGLVGGKSENQRLLGSSTTSLSPGLLALIPDGAIAGIDELHALGDDKVFTALNEAMEAGEVHVNMQMKGTIRTPTPILCCSNPRGGDNTRFDMAPDAEPFLEQAKFPGAFTSRFDFIFGFFDVVDSELDGAIFAGMAGAMNVEENDPYAAFPIPDGYKKYLQLARDTVAAEVIWPNEVIEHAKQINHKARQNSVGGARVSKRWGATLLRASNAIARLDLSSTVSKEHVDFAYGILAESLTTKEPGMVGEATSGLSLAQSVVYDEVERLLNDWTIYELGTKDFGKKNDAHDYVHKNWGLDVADYPPPTLKDFDKMLDYFQSHNKVERRGQNIGIKGL
jgi:replicative DNA helicase Mcm|tara:strand:- start:19740 stop:22163 length:2424 start_codon:yes stop_codon:yes gene_type:complete